MNTPNPFSDNFFADRKELVKQSYKENIVEQIKSIDLEKVDYSNVDFKPRNQIVEKQKIYFWIRIYLHEEIQIQPNTDVTIKYLVSGESITTKFICYAKQGVQKNMDENVINYNPEEDKRILCLMVDSERIDANSNDIPFIRCLFKISRWYSPQILKLSELEISFENKPIDYYDIDF